MRLPASMPSFALPRSAFTRIQHSVRTLASSSSPAAYMGENKVNFYSGDPPLNRLSFHRHSTSLLTQHLGHPLTIFLPLFNGNPLVEASGKLSFLSWAEAKAVVGEKGTWFEDDNDGSVKHLQGARKTDTDTVPLVFLGTDERNVPEEEKTLLIKDPAPELNKTNPPVFALDVSRLAADKLDALKSGREFVDARKAAVGFEYWEAGVLAQAKSMVDWNARNKFCAGCGAKTYSLWGGWKLSCSTAREKKEPVCPTLTGLSNVCYPRTDPVIIMAIISNSGDQILLGRQKAWPKGMYSCLAGFIEPGESFEDSVRREVYEEAGVVVGEVMYHSSQPWPYPANLMVGCFGRADPSQTIRLDLDNELEDARWFSREEIQAIMSDPNGTVNNSRDPGAFFNQGGAPSGSAAAIPNFKLPAETAIAGVLTRSWAKDDVVGWGVQGGKL